ncbi:MAG: toprim domain-containing protein [Candidatus Competibacteraceae bacterium]|nr:toprim domain-containing protein [Candidatus Competibacteraceae bacterium]
MEQERRQSFGRVERAKLIQLANKTLYTSEGVEALAYLREQRGLSDKVIETFQVGYVPRRVSHELRGRIITPLLDPYGEPVAITSRHLEVKSFWHEQFDKSFHLYGLNVAKHAILRCGKAIVVEGEFDVTYLHSRGIDMTVGVCGSAFTAFQAAMLARYTDEIYLCFDRDKNGSGQKAVKRALALQAELSPRKMSFIPVYLPMGKDPDDFVKENGRRAFAELLTESKKNADAPKQLWMN